MLTKIEAAKIATRPAPHGDRRRPGDSSAPAWPAKAPCTWFCRANPVTARKRWISGTLETRGAVDRRRRRGQGACLRQEPAPAGVGSASRGGSSAAMP